MLASATCSYSSMIATELPFARELLARRLRHLAPVKRGALTGRLFCAVRGRSELDSAHVAGFTEASPTPLLPRLGRAIVSKLHATTTWL